MQIKDKWDLSEFYSSPEDPQINLDLTKLQKTSVLFESKHKGKVKKYDLHKVRLMLVEFEKIRLIEYKLGAYSQLIFSLNANDSKASALLQKISVALTANSNHFIFVDLELAENQKLQNFSTSKEAGLFQVIFKKLLLEKPFHLEATKEELLNTKSVTSSSGWQDIFEKLNSNILLENPIKTDGKNEPKKITLEEGLKLLYSADRTIRKAANLSVSKSLKENEHFFSHIYNMLLIDQVQNRKLRGYKFSEQARHVSNGLDKEEVDALERSVVKHYVLARRYYKLKSKLLKIKKLTEYDRYAPVGSSNGKQSFNKAVGIVESSFKKFDPEFAQIFREMLASGHVDMHPKKGKHGGAYCMYSPFGLPYVLLNYFGNNRDIKDLAHEHGHAVHDVLTKKLPLSVAHPPLVLAETASVFAEMIVFEDLLSKTETKKEKISLIADKIESVIATIFRQISMYRFEKSAHAYVEANLQIPAEKLREIWRETQLEMFGGSLELTHDYDYWWSYVSHFYASPFYVYSYAFGGLMVFSLYQSYKEEGKSFIPKYKKFLSAGGSLLPRDAVKIFGYDMRKESFWDSGFVLLQNLIEELERLC